MTVGPEHDAPRPAHGNGFSDAVTVAFGDPGAELYGVARLGLAEGGASGLAIVFHHGEPVAVSAEGGVEVSSPSSWDEVSAAGLDTATVDPLRAWRLQYAGDDAAFDLELEATGAVAELDPEHDVARAGGMAGYEQPVRVRGSASVRGERIEIGGLGQRHPMIPPEVPDFSFHAPLLVPFARRTKLGGELPMRSKGQEARRLLAPEPPQNFANGAGQIVVPQGREQPAEVLKRVLVRLEKRLLRRARIRAVEGRPTRHAPHTEHLQRDLLVAQDRDRFVPIDLGLLAPGVRLRHADQLAAQALCAFPVAHILAHRRRRDRCVRPLATQPIVDAARRVPLLPWRQAVGRQNRIDEVLHRRQRRLRPRRVGARRRHRIGQRLAHHPPMHAQLAGHSFNRPDPELILPSNLCEQLHAGSPVQPTLLDPAGIETG